MALQRKFLTQEDKLLHNGKHSISEFNYELPTLCVILMQVTAGVGFQTYTKVHIKSLSHSFKLSVHNFE
jgi:hypothetical protein